MEQEATLAALLVQMTRVADALEVIARPGKDYTPDYMKPIEEYRTFEWATINASVIKSDQDGPTHVQWNGHVYTRRSPKNKFEPAIWFSRATGKDEENGETAYARLITFREIKDADALPDKAKDLTRTTSANGNNRQPAGPSTQAPRKSAPGTSAPGPLAPVSYANYLKEAAVKSIAKEAAEWIAKQVGIIDQSADYSSALRLIPFFYEAKHAGKRLTEGWELLETNEKDPEKAILALK